MYSCVKCGGVFEEFPEKCPYCSAGAEVLATGVPYTPPESPKAEQSDAAITRRHHAQLIQELKRLNANVTFIVWVINIGLVLALILVMVTCQA